MPRLVLLLALVLVGSLPLADAASPRFLVRVAPDAATIEPAAGVDVTQVNETNDSITFNVSNAARAEGVFRLEGRFVVERVRQIVPRVDGAIPPEVVDADVNKTSVTAFNATSEGAVARFAFAFQPGNHTVSFTRDVEPPTFGAATLKDIQFNLAVIETRTNEPAIADLVVTSGQRAPVLFRTPEASFVQTFPVSGLDANTDYDFNVTFRDFSGNVAVMPPGHFRTPARPVVPVPTITLVTPANGSTVASASSITLHIVDTSGSVRAVMIYLDKTAAPDPTALLQGETLTYTPREPIGPGTHRLVVEATNELGGSSQMFASFTVGGRPSPGAPMWTVLAMSALAAAVGATRRRGW